MDEPALAGAVVEDVGILSSVIVFLDLPGKRKLCAWEKSGRGKNARSRSSAWLACGLLTNGRSPIFP